MGRDYAVITGTQIFAPDSGTIVWSATTGNAGFAMVLRSAVPDSRGLMLDTYFFHLQGAAPGIHEQSVVHAGQLIALSDDSGYSTGPHLHFEQHVQAPWSANPFPAGSAPRSTVVVPCMTQTDAKPACSTLHDHSAIPPIGSHVRMSGTFVQDNNHAKWNEIHPVWRIIVIP
jgi:hypothetical protein